MSDKELPIEVLSKLEVMRQEDLRSLAAKERELANLIKDIDAKQNLRTTRIEDSVVRIEKLMEKHEEERRREEESLLHILEGLKTKVQEFETKFTVLSTKEGLKYELMRYGAAPIIAGSVVAVITILAKLAFGV